MEKILLIEDDQALAMAVEFSLKKEGFSVVHAASIKEGNELFKREDCDLILLDVMLPDGNGYDLCKNVRETSDLPVIFLTACDEEVNVVLGLDIGGDDYITKPFRVKELISRIRAALRRKTPVNKVVSNCIASGDIMLYPLETKVIKKENEITLTGVEYKLLAIFMQNPMQTLNRNTILQKLWDIEGEFIDDNTLSVYIRRMREKIEDNPSNPECIVTVRGIGYKWNKRCN